VGCPPVFLRVKIAPDEKLGVIVNVGSTKDMSKIINKLVIK